MFDVLSQNKKVSTLTLLNEYKLKKEDVLEIEKKLFANENIITTSVLICSHCGSILSNGLFYKPFKNLEECNNCKKTTDGKSRILIFSKKKIDKSD